jgi:hypothetical protein
MESMGWYSVIEERDLYYLTTTVIGRRIGKDICWMNSRFVLMVGSSGSWRGYGCVS